MTSGRFGVKVLRSGLGGRHSVRASSADATTLDAASLSACQEGELRPPFSTRTGQWPLQLSPFRRRQEQRRLIPVPQCLRNDVSLQRQTMTNLEHQHHGSLPQHPQTKNDWRDQPRPPVLVRERELAPEWWDQLHQELHHPCHRLGHVW